MKIKICLHTENMSSGGMTHSCRNIAKYINKEKFELYLATATFDNDQYANELIKEFNPSNVFRYPREPGWMYEYNPITGEYPPPVEKHPLVDWLNNTGIDILHDNRSGTYFFPLNHPDIKAKKIEYNVFGGKDISENISRTLCISQGVYNDWVKQMLKAAPHLVKRGLMLNPAVSLPETNDNLREELGIDEETIVIGRSSNAGRGDVFNFSGYAYLEKILNNQIKTIFLSPSTDNYQLELIKQLGIKNIIVLPHITNYKRMSAYYNTIDISAHNRGESFGCSVAEPIIHGKPVVTVGWCNYEFTPSTAQEELILDRNYCAIGNSKESTEYAYASILLNLVKNGREYCKQEGNKMRERIYQRCAAPYVVHQLEKIYEEVYNE